MAQYYYPEITKEENERIIKYLEKIARGEDTIPEDIRSCDMPLEVIHATHAATTEEEAWERLGMVDEGYLLDWYISSVSDEDEPVWTEEHIKELYNDFIVIPRKVRLNEL